jgi:hypothetical protein
MNFANLRAPSGHALCRFLRCKEMYYSSAEMAERARTDPKGFLERKYFWCEKTFKAEGPEGELAGADECPPSRGCYEA